MWLFDFSQHITDIDKGSMRKITYVPQGNTLDPEEVISEELLLAEDIMVNCITLDEIAKEPLNSIKTIRNKASKEFMLLRGVRLKSTLTTHESFWDEKDIRTCEKENTVAEIYDMDKWEEYMAKYFSKPKSVKQINAELELMFSK
jgi:hypothetical protein